MKILLAFCSACHPHRFDIHLTTFEEIFFDPLGSPSAPKSHPWEWPGGQNENPIWYVLYLSFVRTHTKFGIKIFEIDFVIEFKWYLTFWPLPKAPGGGAKRKFAVARPIHVSNSHTKLGWILSKGLGGDSIMDGQTEGGDYNIPFAFFKKSVGIKMPKTMIQ